jgi:hypothetical protein
VGTAGLPVPSGPGRVTLSDGDGDGVAEGVPAGVPEADGDGTPIQAVDASIAAVTARVAAVLENALRDVFLCVLLWALSLRP